MVLDRLRLLNLSVIYTWAYYEIQYHTYYKTAIFHYLYFVTDFAKHFGTSLDKLRRITCALSKPIGHRYCPLCSRAALLVHSHTEAAGIQRRSAGSEAGENS